MPGRSEPAASHSSGATVQSQQHLESDKAAAFGALSRTQRRRGYAWGVAAPFLCTLVDWPLRHWVGQAGILMTYLLGVFLVASRCGRGPSMVALLLTAPLFAFYFARPIFSFAIQDLENVIGLAVMIVVANVTGRLLEKSKLQAELARQREIRASALYRLSRDLAAAQDHESVGRIAVEHIYDEFGAASVVLNVDVDNRLQFPSSLPLPMSLTGTDLAEAQRIFEARKFKQENQIAYYPLKGSLAWQGLLMMQAVRPFPEQSSEPAAFLDTFCHLIAQTLERIQFAAQAKEATLQAETEAMRNALLSSISHDLRTPLTRIIGAANTLIENDTGFDPSERRDFNHIVLEEAQRMSELTGKLLDMARLSSGEIILHRDWNAIEEIVGSALNRLDKHLQDRPVRTVLPDNLPLLWIDAVLIEQVLVNLIENALKYSPAGSPIDIGGQIHDGYCRLTVADYGPGIARGRETKIFEKFYRGVAESHESGVGLGLALCKAIVEAHGGSINAGNRPGKGAEFVIALPLREPPAFVEPDAHGSLS
jgi:two-component system sensor histidine kinase KdpD